MTEEQKLEYQEIRDEYALLSQMISTTLNFSVAGSLALLSFLGTKEVAFGLFVLPLLIIYPACFIIISRIQSILRLAAYLIVFIEPKSELKFETRLLKAQSRKKAKLRFSKTIIWVFFGLLCIDIGLFVSKGYFNWWQLICYAFSLLIYSRIYYLISKDWKKGFIEAWKEIKLSEK